MSRVTAAAIALVVFVAFFDSFAQYPIISPYARQLGAEAALVGAVVAAYSAVNLVGNVVAGYLVDRFGRKRLLVLGLGTTAVAVFLYTLAANPIQLLAIRGLHGLTAAVAAPAAFALLGDLYPRSKRGRAMGASGALIAVAAIAGPATGGVLGDRLGYSAVFRVVAGLLLLAAVVALTLVAEPEAARERRVKPPRALLSLLTRRSLVRAYLAALTLSFGLGILVTALPLRLADLGFGSSGSGGAFSAYALFALAVMASPLSRLGDAGGHARPIGLGLSLCGLALGLSQLTTSYTAVLALMSVFGVGFGLLFPAMNAQVADASQTGERGSAFGVFYAFYSAGVVVGALAAGRLGAPAAVGFGPLLLGGAVLLLVGSGYLVAAPSARSAVGGADEELLSTTVSDPGV